MRAPMPTASAIQALSLMPANQNVSSARKLSIQNRPAA